MDQQASTETPICQHLIASMETLGIVAAFLVREAPFSEFRAATLIRAIEYQLSSRNHVCIIKDERLVGYCGWIPITRNMGEKWMAGQGELSPVPEPKSDAVACNIVACLDPRHVLPMIRAGRKLNPQKQVFLKRDRSDGKTRKATVRNVIF